MTNTLTFKIPFLPKSFNQLYKINYNFREVYLSKEGRDFKDKVKMFMPRWNPPKEAHFALNIMIFNDWYYKNGNLRKLDLQNLDKLLIDAIFEKLGIDDSHVFQLHLLKVQSNEKACTVKISILTIL